MSDAELRQVERRWQETGAPADQAALFQAQVRAGALPPEALPLYASLGGHPTLGDPLTGPALVDVAWTCIEWWLERNAPKNLANLAGPADPDAVQALAERLELPFPPALFAHWARHDGQLKSDPCGYGCFEEFLSTAAALDRWEMLESCWDEDELTEFKSGDPNHPPEVRSVIWSHRWFPVLGQVAGGDGIYLDFDPTSRGSSGQVIDRTNSCTYTLLAPSLERFLAQYARRLLEGEFLSDEDGELFTNDPEGREQMQRMRQISRQSRGLP